ncbi:hypothetical protein PF007_g32177 [Phytophthora fragariae]|uniref:Uncharacterized protein n=1 Tax=Phytophthora fragariae TaxID=53985 RepID=A0A6A3PJN5_9STRA|nr:hypothetical protein PF007_g32177 [Phytophthora fragariae]
MDGGVLALLMNVHFVEGNMSCFRMREGSGVILPARAGKISVKPATIKVFAEIAGMDIIPATKWDAASTASLLEPLEVEFLTLSIYQELMFDESMEPPGCIEET